MRQPPSYNRFASAYLLERFSYYSVRSLLILSLLKTFQLSQEQAGQIYVYMTGLILFLPVIGGAIVDVFLRKHQPLRIICGMIMAGAALLGLSVMIKSIALLYIGLIVFALGEVLFRPTLYAQVSHLYENKTSYDLGAGFLLLTVAANLSAFFAPLVAGTLDQEVLAGSGFLISALAISAGLVVIKNLPLANQTDDKMLKNFNSILVILVAIVFPYELLKGIFGLKIETLTDGMTGLQALVPTAVGIASAIFLAVYWSRQAIHRTVSITQRFFIGSLLGLVATVAIYGVMSAKSSVANQTFLNLTLLPSILFEVTELFVTPLALAYVAKTSSVRFRTLVIGGWLTTIQVIALPISYLCGYLSVNTTWNTSALAAAAALFVVTAFCVDKTITKKFRTQPTLK